MKEQNHKFSILHIGHYLSNDCTMCYRSDMGQLHHKCNRLHLLATCSIMIVNKQNHIVIDYDCIESNHDFNRHYICLEAPSKEYKTHSHGFIFDVSIFLDNI